MLVYNAFKLQLEANDLLRKQIKKQEEEQIKSQNRDYILGLFNLIKEEISSFSIVKLVKSGEVTEDPEYTGNKAFRMISLALTQQGEAKETVYDLKSFYSLIRLIYNFLLDLDKTELKITDLTFFVQGVSHLYHSRIGYNIAPMKEVLQDEKVITDENRNYVKLALEMHTRIDSLINKINARINDQNNTNS